MSETEGRNPLLFSLRCGEPLLQQVTRRLGLEPAPCEERDFEDGEFKIRPLVSVRRREAVIVQSLCASEGLGVNDVLMRVLFLAGALRDHGAAGVHLIAPYLCYARKDRRTKSRDPLSLRYLAQLFEAAGLTTVTVGEIHNPAAYENAFRIPTLHLDLDRLLADYLLSRFGALLSGGGVSIATPDLGGAKRAEALRKTLSERSGCEIGSALVYKQRSGGVVSGDLVAGQVSGQSVILVDDMIVGGTTLIRAASQLTQQGARDVYAVAVHGLFAEDAAAKLSESPLREIAVTDSVPARENVNLLGHKLVRLEIAPLLAESVRRLFPDVQWPL